MSKLTGKYKPDSALKSEFVSAGLTYQAMQMIKYLFDEVQIVVYQHSA